MLSNNRTENLAKFACAGAGALWGLYWIPLRGLDAAGVNGLWATTLFYLIPLIFLFPIAIIRWQRIVSAGWPLQWIAIPAMLALVLYSNAFLYTDVIRAILLFYLTPIWSALLARIWLKEPITRSRIAAFVLALLGLFVIFNGEQGIPTPQNAGDWMGLGSGLFWAVAANVMRREASQNTIDILFMWFFWVVVFGALLALLPFIERPNIPDIRQIAIVLPWFIPVVLFLVIPAFYAIAWGTPLLNPGTAGILFMTEISVGAISAALLTDEAFGIRQVLGVGLITGAGLTEVLPGNLRFQWPPSLDKPD